MRASTRPGVTWSPGFTSTSVTVPAVLKLRPRLCAGVTVPAADAVRATAPRCTRAVVDAAGAGADRPAYAYVAAPRKTRASAPTATHSFIARKSGRPGSK